MKRLKCVAVCLAAGLVSIGAMGAGAFAQTVNVTQAAPAGPGWPRELSDLPHDTDYVLGELPNGMRYMILPNQTPPRQVALRMLIDAGSMQERPGEEGVAHFLEHLAFRGTTKYPDGEVQRALEGI